ncbi:hypothetical protein CAEBREN_26084 [Caenorhabditis brenneri]|uniref:F-box domain-containing protein n=1 Tax=Caenorhabditis brenneri TaxID=135651 RepID=G0NCJ1_CAEBE|nr:hypothetical protein CAEBREN_26084 [Caenorhabditis brenneri]
MTIAFRYLPYLVQHKVMDQMDLFDIFSIHSISKKSQALAKSYFNRHNFELSPDSLQKSHSGRNTLYQSEAYGNSQKVVKKTETFFEGVGKLSGALPVRQLTVADYYGWKESVTFSSKQCYKVEKADWTPAVVYRERFSGGIYFRTDFEDAVIGEGV